MVEACVITGVFECHLLGKENKNWLVCIKYSLLQCIQRVWYIGSGVYKCFYIQPSITDLRGFWFPLMGVFQTSNAAESEILEMPLTSYCIIVCVGPTLLGLVGLTALNVLCSSSIPVSSPVSTTSITLKA